jgi:hypothetical protein
MRRPSQGSTDFTEDQPSIRKETEVLQGHRRGRAGLIGASQAEGEELMRYPCSC